MSKETTNEEILDAINSFSSNVDEKFINIDERFNKIDDRFDKNDKRLDKIESLMVTKDYLDDKLGDLRGDLVVLMRKEDVKLNTLVNILESKKLITEEEKKKIQSMEPFPQLAL